jgi:hypothetical protein
MREGGKQNMISKKPKLENIQMFGTEGSVIENCSLL